MIRGCLPGNKSGNNKPGIGHGISTYDVASKAREIDGVHYHDHGPKEEFNRVPSSKGISNEAEKYTSDDTGSVKGENQEGILQCSDMVIALYLKL